MTPEQIPLQTLRRLPRNAKDHDIGLIHESIDEFGFIDRIVINRTTGHLLSGHGRVDTLQQRKAAGKKPPEGITIDPRGDDWIVPVDYVDLPAEKEEAAAIALNETVRKGGYKEDVLAIVLADLAAQGPEKLRGTGYDLDDVDGLLKNLAGKTIFDKDRVILDQAVQLKPAKEYIVVFCEDESQFTALREKLDLKLVRRGGYDLDSEFAHQRGVERVVPAARLLGLLK